MEVRFFETPAEWRAWIDETSYRNRFTPRKPTSTWSNVNIAKVEALEAAGKMTDAGRAAFARRTEANSAISSFEGERRLAQLVESSAAGEAVPPLAGSRLRRR